MGSVVASVAGNAIGGALLGKAGEKLFGMGYDDSGVKATKEGYAAMLKAQTEALDYLKGQDELPRQYRQDALGQLAGIYGFGPGGEEAKQAFYQGIPDDPYYQMMSQGAEEAYLRGQSATGQLRGGSSIMGVANLENQIRQQTVQNQLSGIEGMMNMAPDYTGDIYQGMYGLGQTQGQGIMDAARARQAAKQAQQQNLLGLGQFALGGLETAGKLGMFGLGWKGQ